MSIFARARLALAALALVLLVAEPRQPVAAFDLFARHQVTVQFATSDGRPMADSEVRVFAPGEPNHPALTGRTKNDGKFEFGADQDGLWTAEARNGTEVARATVRVGVGQAQNREPISPFWLIGALLVLLALAFWYRLARIRKRRR